MLISSENTRREISTFAVFFIQSLVTNLSFFGIFLLLGFGYLPNLQKSLHHGAAAHSRAHHGRMAEWLIVPPWKGGIRKFRIEGSNPSPSARTQTPKPLRLRGFSLFALSTRHIPEFYFRRFRQNPPDCDISRHAIDCGGGSFGGSFFGGSLVGLTRFTAQR